MIVVIGYDETESKTYTIKNLTTGEEKVGSLDSLKLDWIKEK